MSSAPATPVTPDTPRVILAPMEGLLDHTLRDMLTRVGGVDLCVTEFIRVTNTVLPSGVTATPRGKVPTAIVAPGVPVATSIGVSTAKLVVFSESTVAPRFSTTRRSNRLHFGLPPIPCEPR
mgnify:CR=1 FL=1